MNNWITFDNGRSIGKSSAEGAVILRDEEYNKKARITIKRGIGYISVACNIYGRADHTRFFVTVAEAQREYILMKAALGNMVENVFVVDAKDIKIWEAISEFVRRFP